MKGILGCAAGALVALAVSGPAIAQTPKRLANPSFTLVDGGTVYASARHPDGGTVLIGTFSSINGVPRAGIARLRPDGSVDASWGNVLYQSYSQNFNRPLAAIDASGAVYVTGMVTVLPSNQSYSGVVKFSASTGEVVADWRSVGSFPFLSMVADATGLYVGKMDGLHKVSTKPGSIEWTAPYSSTSLALDGRGFIYAVATAISETPRQFFARFSVATGELDESWNPAVIPVDGWQQPLAVDACGSVYVAGHLSVNGGQPRDRVVKISASDGRVDPKWDPGDVTGATTITTDAECSVYLGGHFEAIGGQERKNVAKLSGVDGHVVNDWLPGGACCDVSELAIDARGRVTIAGSILRVGTQSRLGFASLDTATGEAGPAIDAESQPFVTVIAKDPKGGVFVGGSFAKAGSLPRHGLLRVRTNGTLDTEWSPSLEGIAQVAALAALPGGEVYVGGSFDGANFETRRNAAKFVGSTGVLDHDWNPGPDGRVEAFAFGADDSVFVGGSFSTLGGLTRKNIAKLSSRTGAVFPGWDPQANGAVLSLAVDGFGAVYAGGHFNEIGGQTHWRLAKLASDSGAVLPNWTAQTGSAIAMLAVTDTAVHAAASGWPVQKLSIATGAADPAWSPSRSEGVLGFAIAADGSIYGAANNATGETRLKRYLVDSGAEDPAWNVSLPDRLIGPVAVDTRGSVYVGTLSPSGLAAYSTDTVFFDTFDP